MVKETTEHKKLNVKSKVLHAATRQFLAQGYAQSTVRGIASEAGVNIGSLVFAFKNKENILCELVSYVFECQFNAAREILGDRACDKILFYAVETTLQLYMAESSESMREMYNISYSLPNSAQIIYRTMTEKLQDIFQEYLPQFETKDFYERELASAGIMRNFISVPCDMYFTMQRKVQSFLETTLLLYEVPKEKIQEAVEFVQQFDFEKVSSDVIANMLEYLKNQT